VQIKQLVKENAVRFAYYRQGYAYYTLQSPVDGEAYRFPVPLADVGDATLLAQDKAILFMRYIRQALADGTFAKVEQ
jgi:hypothetical protein